MKIRALISGSDEITTSRERTPVRGSTVGGTRGATRRRSIWPSLCTRKNGEKSMAMSLSIEPIAESENRGFVCAGIIRMNV